MMKVFDRYDADDVAICLLMFCVWDLVTWLNCLDMMLMIEYVSVEKKRTKFLIMMKYKKNDEMHWCLCCWSEECKMLRNDWTCEMM